MLDLHFLNCQGCVSGTCQSQQKTTVLVHQQNMTVNRLRPEAGASRQYHVYSGEDTPPQLYRERGIREKEDSADKNVRKALDPRSDLHPRERQQPHKLHVAVFAL